MVSRSLIRRSLFDRMFDISIYFILVILACSILYPFWYKFIISISNDSTGSLSILLWPEKITFGAYFKVLSNPKIYTAYYNTVFRTLVGTVLTLIVTITAAFSLSKREMPLRNIIMIMITFTMFFSGGLIPTYLVVKGLNLINTRAAYILPLATTPFYLIIVRNYFMTLDKGIEDSAFIDGAGYAYILFKIIIPVSKPIIATIALWSAVMHWNSWFDALIYCPQSRLIVLQLLLRRILIDLNYNEMQALVSGAVEQSKGLSGEATFENFKAATIFIAILPIVAVYPFLQKYFVKGIMIGSIKG